MGRGRRRTRRARVAAGGVGAVAVLAAAQPFVALGAGAGSVPSFSVDTVSSGAEVTWTSVDPLTTPIEAAVVGDGSAACFGNGEHGNGCFDRISSMVGRHNVAAGFTANYNNGVDILGLAVVDHHAWSLPNPNTTTLCVGDAISGATRPTISFTKNADATQCRTAVSGERIVASSQVSIEGQGQDGVQGAFWWSVEENSPVQRTLVGLRQDGTLVVAVVSARKSGVRNGMTLPGAARWLIAHGVVDAIALDGGHQAEAYVDGRGSIVPLQAGEPGVQVSLLLGHTVPAVAPPSVTPTPSPAPAALAAPAVAATPSPAHTPAPTPRPRGPVPGTGVLGDIALPRLPESGALPIAGAPSSGAFGGRPPVAPGSPAFSMGAAASGAVTGQAAW